MRLAVAIFSIALLLASSFQLQILQLNSESTRLQIEVRNHSLLKLQLRSSDISSILAREKNLFIKMKLNSAESKDSFYEAILSTHSNLKYLENQGDQSKDSLRIYLKHVPINVIYLSKENQQLIDYLDKNGYIYLVIKQVQQQTQTTQMQSIDFEAEISPGLRIFNSFAQKQTLVGQYEISSTNHKYLDIRAKLVTEGKERRRAQYSVIHQGKSGDVKGYGTFQRKIPSIENYDFLISEFSSSILSFGVNENEHPNCYNTSSSCNMSMRFEISKFTSKITFSVFLTEGQLELTDDTWTVSFLN